MPAFQGQPQMFQHVGYAKRFGFANFLKRSITLWPADKALFANAPFFARDIDKSTIIRIFLARWIKRMDQLVFFQKGLMLFQSLCQRQTFVDHFLRHTRRRGSEKASSGRT